MKKSIEAFKMCLNDHEIKSKLQQQQKQQQPCKDIRKSDQMQI